MEGQTGEAQRSLDDIKPMEGQSIDLAKYDKKEVVIEKASIVSLPSKYHEIGHAEVLKVESEVLETIEREVEGKKETIEFRASELFSLTTDDNGRAIGFSLNEKSNLMKFAKDLGIKEPEKAESLKILVDSILGKKALLKLNEKEKDGRTFTFLKFRY